jgi:hypothetical protein
MVSFLPAATELRSDLKQLGNSDAVTWVDVTAPGDGCSFALCDPVAVSGQGDGTQNGPLVLSAAFTQTLSDARICPGAGFAMIEGPLLIAAILRKYRVSMTDHGRPVPVAHLTVRAKDGIWLHFQSRD